MSRYLLIEYVAHMLSIINLATPTIWEWYNDRKGDFDKSQDVVWRIYLMISAAGYAWYYGADWFWSLNMSAAFFLLMFDYGINLILEKSPWYSYVSKSKIDRIVDWIIDRINWRGMMAIRIVYFLVSLYLFIVWR